MTTAHQLRLQIAQRLRCRPSSVQTHQNPDGRYHAIVMQYASLKYVTEREALAELLQQVKQREGVSA